MMWGADPRYLKLEVFDFKRDLAVLGEVCDVHQDIATFNDKIEQVVREMKERYTRMANEGHNNIEAWNRAKIKRGDKTIVPYRLIMIDEYASTTHEAKGFGEYIELLSSMGRAAVYTSL